MFEATAATLMAPVAWNLGEGSACAQHFALLADPDFLQCSTMQRTCHNGKAGITLKQNQSYESRCGSSSCQDPVAGTDATATSHQNSCSWHICKHSLELEDDYNSHAAPSCSELLYIR